MPGAKPGIFVSGSMWGSRLAPLLHRQRNPCGSGLCPRRPSCGASDRPQAPPTRHAPQLRRQRNPCGSGLCPRRPRRGLAGIPRRSLRGQSPLPQFICSHSSSAPTVHLLPQFICSHNSSAPTVHLLPQFICSHNSPASTTHLPHTIYSPTTTTTCPPTITRLNIPPPPAVLFL